MCIFFSQGKKGEIRPPKLKTEDPNKSYVQRPVKRGWDYGKQESQKGCIILAHHDIYLGKGERGEKGRRGGGGGVGPPFLFLLFFVPPSCTQLSAGRLISILKNLQGRQHLTFNLQECWFLVQCRGRNISDDSAELLADSRPHPVDHLNQIWWSSIGEVHHRFGDCTQLLLKFTKFGSSLGFPLLILNWLNGLVLRSDFLWSHWRLSFQYFFFSFYPHTLVLRACSIHGLYL